MEKTMGTSEAPGDEPMRIAAPACAAALIAIAGIVGLSLNEANDGGGPAASAGYSPPPGPGGAGIPGAAQNQTPGAQGAPEMAVEIVVKFRDDDQVKDITDLFWRDRGAARSRFASFKRRWPALSQLRLERVTYSNELVLVSSGNADADEMRRLARTISRMPEVSYAEPNSTAHPGGR